MTEAVATHADRTDDILDLLYGSKSVLGMMVRDGVQAAVVLDLVIQKAIDLVWEIDAVKSEKS